MFKELFEANTESVQKDKNNIYWDKDMSRWGIESQIMKFGKRYGTLKGVFATAQNYRDGRYSERWLFEIDTKYEDMKKFPSPGSGYEIYRYVSLTTLAGEMAPVVAVNTSNGKIKFLEDYEAELEDSKWQRPQKVQYMRMVK